MLGMTKPTTERNNRVERLGEVVARVVAKLIAQRDKGPTALDGRENSERESAGAHEAQPVGKSGALSPQNGGTGASAPGKQLRGGVTLLPMPGDEGSARNDDEFAAVVSRGRAAGGASPAIHHAPPADWLASSSASRAW